MREIGRFARRRPLCAASVCAVLGAALGAYASCPPWVYGLAAVAVTVWLLARRRLAAPFCLILLAMAWAAAALSLPGGYAARDGAYVTGRVAGAVQVQEKRSVFTLTGAALDGRDAGTNIRVYLYDAPEIAPGDRLEMTADTWLAQGVRNPGGFDFARWLRARGVYLLATANGADCRVTGRGQTPAALLDRARRAIAGRLDLLCGEHAPLARSIALGDKSALPEETYAAFRDSGIAHLLAVSGLHIGCVAAALTALLSLCGLSRRRAYLAVTLMTFGYAAMIGLPASAVRAALMYALIGGARALGRPHDALTGLAAAALILLAVNPLAVTDAGFALSFSAVTGILLLLPTLTDLCGRRVRNRFARRIVEALCVSLAAQLGTTPAVCTLYGTISPYAPLVNLVMVPLVSLTLPVTLAAAGLSALIPGATAALGLLPRALLGAVASLAHWFANWPGAALIAPTWDGWLIALFAVAAALASAYLRGGRAKRAGWTAALFLLTALSYPAAKTRVPEGLFIACLDAGQGDCAIVCAGNQTYLIDAGRESSPAADALKYYGRALDGAFVTHPHADHGGGLSGVLAARDIPVLYLPQGFDAYEPDGAVAEGIELARTSGTRVETLRAGDRMELGGGAVLTVLHPGSGDPPKAANDISLALLLTYGQGDALFAGDLSAAKLAAAAPPDVEMWKVSHHGAKDAATQKLLGMLSPEVAVIPVGRNSYGHPADKTLALLENAGARVYRSDESGAILLTVGRDGQVEAKTFL